MAAEPWYLAGTPNPSTNRLTFGVEMEFSIACLIDPTRADPDPSDTRQIYNIVSRPVLSNPNSSSGSAAAKAPAEIENAGIARQHVAETLKAAGIYAIAEKWNVSQSSSGSDVSLEAREHPEAWTVKDDGRVDEMRPKDGRYDYQPIEITTPAMYFSKEAVEEVLYVATVMSNTYRCVLPTGLHIHVGDSDRGFKARTVQNLVATYFTFEEMIELIHPRSRIDFFMAPSLQRGSMMMLETLKERDQTKDMGLRYLLAAKRTDIGKLWDATKAIPSGNYEKWQNLRPALNLRPLAKYPNMKTIEFRQHAMTLDPMEIAHWLRFCVQLLEFADTVDQEVLRIFLYRYSHETKETMNLKTILEELGMPREAEYFAGADGVTMHHRT
jgi:hypothetical protein